MNSEVKKKIALVSERLQVTAVAYKSLNEDLSSIFEKLSCIEAETEKQSLSGKFSKNIDKESINEISVLLEELQSIDRMNLKHFKEAKSASEAVIPKIYDTEPLEAANVDVDKLNRVFTKVLEDWTNFEKAASARLKNRLEEFRADQENFMQESLQVRFIHER